MTRSKNDSDLKAERLLLLCLGVLQLQEKEESEGKLVKANAIN